MLRKAVYIAGEIAALYLIVAIFMCSFVWFLVGIDGLLGQILFLLSLVAPLPFAIVGATIGLSGNRGLSAVAFGFYDPIRPIAAILPLIRMAQGNSSASGFGHRQELHFVWDNHGAPNAYDTIAELSSHLKQQGIAHSNLGGVIVRDNRTKWQLEPAAGENALSGWVESPFPEDREQVRDGIEDFLINGLRLRLA